MNATIMVYETVPSLALSVVVSLRPVPESLLALVACVVCEFTDEAREALYNQTYYAFHMRNFTTYGTFIKNLISVARSLEASLQGTSKIPKCCHNSKKAYPMPQQVKKFSTLAISMLKYQI